MSRFYWLIPVALLSSGCAAQLGGRAGFGGKVGGGEPVHFVESTGVGANMIFQPSSGSRNGVYLGGELENRFETQYGSRWNLGIGAGFGRVAERHQGSTGLELHLDVGTRVEEAVLFRDGNVYLGATASLPIWLYPQRQLADVNADPWVLTRAFELVVQVRERTSFDRFETRYDVGAGLVLRTRFVSDLLQ